MPHFPDLLTIHPLWVALPLALIPGALHHWWARTLTSGDASTLPERHLVLTQRVSSATTLCALVIVMLSTRHAAWILPLEFVVLASATHRTRRVLLGETLTLPRYLLWRTRLLVGWFGLWWFVAFAPMAVLGAVPARWPIAATVLAIALAWHHRHSRVLLRLVGATPLARPDLEEPFNEVIRRSMAIAPALYRAGEPGGVFANALALPSLTHQAVLFFDTLLERLTPREITAIFAHEVAHLEYYHRRLLIRFYAVTVAIVAAFVLGPALAWPSMPELATWLPVLVLFTLIGGFIVRARRMQPKETAADLRAIELCGDPEALVSALTRLHELAHVPRRWSARMEQRATHPSLARRLNAIRQKTAASTTPLADRLVVDSSEPGRRAFIDRDRIGFVWLARDAPVDAVDMFVHARRAEMFAYADLRELRVAPRRTEGLMLVAVDRHAQRVMMPIHERDAASVQQALDAVDHLVVALPAPQRPLAPRVAAAFVMAFAFALNAHIPILAPALLALRRPSRALMLALASGLTVVALLDLLDSSPGRGAPFLLMTLALILVLTARTIARSDRTPQNEGRVWFWAERIALLVPVVAGLVLLLLAGDRYDLHTTARDQSWIGGAAAVLAVFLAMASDRASRRVSVPTAAVAALVMFAGSSWFLLGVVRDPLASAMPLMTETRETLTATAQQSVAGEFASLTTSPAGDAYLLSADEEETDEDEPPPPRKYMAGGFDGWSRALAATDAVILDAQHVLVLRRGEGSSDLRVENARTGDIGWTLTLPHADVTMLQAARDGRWRLMSRRGSAFTRIEGRVGSTDTRETTWPMQPDRQSYLASPAFDDGPIALGLATAWRRPIVPWLRTGWHQSTTLLRAGADGTRVLATSHLTVDCPSPPIGIAGFVCTSYDGRRSRVWRVDQVTGRLVPVGASARPLWRLRSDDETTATAHIGSNPAVIDIPSQTIRTLALPWNGCWMNDFAVSAEQLVTVCTTSGSTRITRYRIPNRTTH